MTTTVVVVKEVVRVVPFRECRRCRKSLRPNRPRLVVRGYTGTMARGTGRPLSFNGGSFCSVYCLTKHAEVTKRIREWLFGDYEVEVKP